jgi:hypothetical protein
LTPAADTPYGCERFSKKKASFFFGRRLMLENGSQVFLFQQKYFLQGGYRPGQYKKNSPRAL